MDGIEDGGSIHPSSVRDELGAAGMDLGELGQVVGLPVAGDKATRGAPRGGESDRGSSEKTKMERCRSTMIYRIYPNFIYFSLLNMVVFHSYVGVPEDIGLGELAVRSDHCKVDCFFFFGKKFWHFKGWGWAICLEIMKFYHLNDEWHHRTFKMRRLFHGH